MRLLPNVLKQQQRPLAALTTSDLWLQLRTHYDMAGTLSTKMPVINISGMMTTSRFDAKLAH